jgi:hypothetical protein
MVITKLEKLYQDIFPPNISNRLPYIYIADDFIKLNSDAKAAHIYANGEFDSWFLWKQY